MPTATEADRSVANPPAQIVRPYEDVWAENEKRHAWKIAIAEWHNPPVKEAKLPYAWQDYDNRHAAAFREKYRLQELIAGSADDWEAVLRLRHWAFTHVRDGNPSFPAEAPEDIVSSSLAGATYYCTYFAYAFVAAANAVGFSARHLGIDCEHERGEASSHHGVADVWVNSLRKWVAVDPNYDYHYELNGVPLNAEEIGNLWRSRKGDGMSVFIGPERREVPRGRQSRVDKHESCGYYWCYIDSENDTFHRRRQNWPNPVVFLVDEERKRRKWYQGDKENSQEHGRYTNGSFITTERYADAYPDLNCVNLTLLPPTKIPYGCRVQFGNGCTPNFSHVLLREDGGAPFRVDGLEYPWRLHPGANSLEARLVNHAGLQGPPSRVVVRVDEDRSRQPEWPDSWKRAD